MVKIYIQNCNNCEMDVSAKEGLKLYTAFSIRHPSAFYLRGKVKGWDGIVHFISKGAQFKIGLLPAVIEKCKDLNYEYKVIDMRKPLDIPKKPITQIGKYKLRPEQIKAVSSILYNKVENIPFHIGVIDYTVNAGKCNGKGTLVYTNQGLVPIERIVDNKGNIIFNGKVLTKEGNLIKPTHGVYNEIKAIKITTKKGYTLICGYDNHRLYTYKNGIFDWYYAKYLKPGDPLPLAFGIDTDNSTTGKALAYTLGALSGDGHISLNKNNTSIHITISGQDYEVAYKVKEVLDNICKSPCEICSHHKFNGFHISKSDTNLFKLLSEKYPELIGLSYEKKVPETILKSNLEDQAYYIAGLFDTDGSNVTGKREFSFSTVCKENARRIQVMLLRLGIPSTLKPKKTSCKGKRGITYRITIRSEYYDKFLEKIPLQVKRKTLSGDLVKRNNYSLKLPFGELVCRFYKNLPWRERGAFKQRYGKTITTQVIKPNRVTLTSLKALYEFTNNDYLKRLIDWANNYYWDYIEKIEIIDSYQCYDFHVPGDENYITNGFLSHNTLIMAALYLSFKKKLKTLLITNDSDWFNQAKREFKDYLPDEQITFVQGSKVTNWSNFSIGMIQSISRNIKTYQRELTKIDMVLVDEADLAGSKQYQNVLTHLYNTRVRIGLSGTIYMSKLAKDRLKNMNLRAFFGEVLAQFKLKDSIKRGYSTNTIVKIVDPNPYYGNWEPKSTNYPDEYKEVITENPISWCLIKNRLKYNISYGRLPALIVCKYVKQAENIYNYLKDTLDKKYTIACAHVNTKTKERKNIMDWFRLGKIDILVSTTIIARGKNFPLLRYMINTADSDSEEKNIQFLGRLVRTCEGKDKVYFDDISYPGHYLSRHGKHRKNYYKKQHLKVIPLGRGRVKDACDDSLPF